MIPRQHEGFNLSEKKSQYSTHCFNLFIYDIPQGAAQRGLVNAKERFLIGRIFAPLKERFWATGFFQPLNFFTPHEAIANWMGLDGCYRGLSIGGMGYVGGGRDRMSSTQMRTPWQPWTCTHAPWPSMYTMVFNGHVHLHRAYLPSCRIFMDIYVDMYTCTLAWPDLLAIQFSWTHIRSTQ